MARPSTIDPDDMLASAERLVAREGGAALTFDAVAREAGVSKGAVLHRFRTKQALLAAMINRLAAREATPAFPDDAGPLEAARAHVARAAATPGDVDPISATLLAAIAVDTNSLAPLRASARAIIYNLTAAGVPPERAACLHFALDGLWIAELLGTSPLTPKERERLVAALANIVTGDE
jgi:AcrR family transcriptional regulator